MKKLKKSMIMPISLILLIFLVMGFVSAADDGIDSTMISTSSETGDVDILSNVDENSASANYDVKEVVGDDSSNSDSMKSAQNNGSGHDVKSDDVVLGSSSENNMDGQGYDGNTDDALSVSKEALASSNDDGVLGITSNDLLSVPSVPVDMNGLKVKISPKEVASQGGIFSFEITECSGYWKDLYLTPKYNAPILLKSGLLHSGDKGTFFLSQDFMYFNLYLEVDNGGGKVQSVDFQAPKMNTQINAYDSTVYYNDDAGTINISAKVYDGAGNELNTGRFEVEIGDYNEYGTYSNGVWSVSGFNDTYWGVSSQTISLRYYPPSSFYSQGTGSATLTIKKNTPSSVSVDLPSSVTYNSGNYTISGKVTVKDNLNVDAGSANVTLTVGSNTYSDIAVNSDGTWSKSVSFADMVPGDFTVKAKYMGNDYYNSNESAIYSLTINKNTPSVSFDDLPAVIYNGGDYTISGKVAVKDNLNVNAGSPTVTLTVGNKTYEDISVGIDGAWSQSGISSTLINPIGGTVKAKYSGNDYYNSNEVTSAIAVKWDVNIENIVVLPVAYGDRNVNVSGNIAGYVPFQGNAVNVTIDIRGNKYNGTVNEDGSYSFLVPLNTALDKGNYDVNVYVVTNDYYIGKEKVFEDYLTVTSCDITIDASVVGISEGSVKVDQNALVTITGIPSEFYVGGNVTVTVNDGKGKEYIINVSDQSCAVYLDVIDAVGTYTLTGQYMGDKNCNPSNIVTKSFTVTKWNAADLQKLIDDAVAAGNGTLILKHDYELEAGPVNINAPFTIEGNSHIIDANGSEGVFSVTADDVTIKDVGIANVNGVAIALNGADADVEDVDLFNITGTAIAVGENASGATIGNVASFNSNGPVIAVNGNGAKLSDIVVFNNNGTAVVVDGDNAIISNVLLTNNTGVDGGAIAINGDGTQITNAKLINNTASKSGGAFYVNGKGTVISDSELSGNTAADGTNNIAFGLNAKDSVIINVTSDNGPVIVYLTEINASSTAYVYQGDAPIVITVKTNAKEGTISAAVNGKNYTGTVKDGVAVITIFDLPVGIYNDVVVSYHDSNGVYLDDSDNVTFAVKVNGAKIVNANVKKDYNSNYNYNIRIIGVDGKPVSGLKIGVTINGKTNSYKTNSGGYIIIKLGKTYTPGKYTVKVSYKHIDSKRVITVNQILNSKKVNKFKKSAKKLVIKAKLKSSNGKPIKGKKISFKINGKTFKAKTNKKGIAKVTIKKKSILKKLKAGKTYKVKITYLKDTISSKLKVIK